MKQSNPHMPAAPSWEKRVEVISCGQARAEGPSPRKRNKNPERMASLRLLAEQGT